MKSTAKRGFTLVEIMIAGGLMFMLLAGLISSFSHFRRVFAKQEEGTEMTQQAAMFLAYLRHDLENAAPSDPEGIMCSQTSLSFNIFLPNSSDTTCVNYVISNKSLFRRLSGKVTPEDRPILDSIATLTWQRFDASSTASETQRIGIGVDVSLGRPKPVTGETSAFFRVQTNIFPIKWNRVLQNKQTFAF